MSSAPSGTPFVQSGSPAGGVPGELCGLAELAFGSLSRYDESGRDQHLALLHTEALELDLTDPAQREFGDYELRERIGEGGMGVVYRARHVPLDRIVAVKLLSAGPWASPEFITRFEHEARNAARMQHPHIVTVFEAGSCDGLQFFSMRLVEGHSLSALLKRGERFTPRAAAMLLRTVAEAVAYAHSLGVLHLDLKPGNVLIDANGAPHVADFGLARRLGNALTIENDEVSGTPAYMAPEQTRAHAQKLTPATDIWGMGVILYELLTGTPPFRADSAPDTLRLVAEGQVRAPRRWQPDLPLDLQAIVMKCLRKDPSERYASARALADDLARFIEGRPVQARPLNAMQRVARWAKREPKLATTIACAIAALVIGLIATTTQWHRADANAHVAKTNAALASQRLWQARIDQAQVAVRAGHNYDALPGLAANIREREAQGLDAREDRVRIAMVERGAPRLIDAIAMGATIYGVALSPDGTHVAVATMEDQKLRVFDTATGKQAWQTSFAGATRFQVGPGEDAQLEVLRYSADGRYLIGRNHNSVPRITPNGLDEVLFDATKGKVLVPPARVVPKFNYATYSPDGEFAVVHTTNGQAALVRTSDWQALGAWRVIGGAGPLWLVTTRAHHVLTNVSGINVLDIRDPRTLAVRHSIRYASGDVLTTWTSSPDGETALIGHQDGQLDLLDCNSGRYRTLSPNMAGRIGWVAFSPHGRWMGAVSDSGEVLVWDTATGKLAAPMMHLDITPEYHREQLFIDAASHTVIASADDEMGLWYLPDATTAPVRLSGELPNAGAFWMRAFAYRPARGLVVSDGGKGNLFLWRVQQLAPRGMRAPAMPPGQLHAVEGDVVAVDGASMRVVNPANGRPVGPELKLPQPPAFAELSVNHASLVAVAGREIQVYDVATWKLRRAPIVLPDDPARVMLSPDARHVLLLFADYHNGRNREIGQIWDLVEGKPIAPAVGFEYLTRFRYSADGRGLMLWENDRLQWLDALSLRPRWAPVSFDRLLAGLEPAKRDASAAKAAVVVTDAQIAAGGSRIEVLTENDPSGASRFWQLDAATGKVLQQNLLSEADGGDAFATVPGRHGVIVQRADFSSPLWWDPRQGAKELASYGKQEVSVLALSPDTTMFARATEDRVVLTSTRDLQWLSPLLPVAVPALDAYREHPTQLAFTPDGNGLIARMRQREWLYWDVRPDLRPIALISLEAALLNPDPTKLKHGLATMLPASERRALRADDPGPPVFLGAFPAESPTPRQPDLSPGLFDLTRYFNTPLVGLAGHNYIAAAYQELTPGAHRFLGVDYDVRGIVVLSEPSFANQVNPDHPPPQEVSGIRPGIDRFAALDLLMTSYDCEEPFNTSNAIVEFDYADGSRARQPLLCGADFVPNYADDAAARIMKLIQPDGGIAPVAWRATNIGSAFHWISTINAVRVVNPHPERVVASIALKATDVAFSSPLFFAITAEPVTIAVTGK